MIKVPDENSGVDVNTRALIIQRRTELISEMESGEKEKEYGNLFSLVLCTRYTGQLNKLYLHLHVS